MDQAGAERRTERQPTSKAASVGDLSLSLALLAPLRIDSNAGARRLLYRSEASPVAFGAFMLSWFWSRLFHLSDIVSVGGLFLIGTSLRCLGT
jgi:hypothetical protein